MLVFEAMIEINSSADLRPIQELIFESRLHLRLISSFAFSCTYNWLLGTDRAEARRERKNGEEDERERESERKKKIGAVFVSGKKTSEGGREIERKIGVVLFWGRRREREREGERERK
jgi:hypothetical protein